MKERKIVDLSDEERENLSKFLSNLKNENLGADYLQHVIDYEYPEPENPELDKLFEEINGKDISQLDLIEIRKKITLEVDDQKLWKEEPSEEVSNFVSDERFKKFRLILLEMNS